MIFCGCSRISFLFLSKRNIVYYPFLTFLGEPLYDFFGGAKREGSSAPDERSGKGGTVRTYGPLSGNPIRAYGAHRFPTFMTFLGGLYNIFREHFMILAGGRGASGGRSPRNIIYLYTI